MIHFHWLLIHGLHDALGTIVRFLLNQSSVSINVCQHTKRIEMNSFFIKLFLKVSFERHRRQHSNFHAVYLIQPSFLKNYLSNLKGKGRSLLDLGYNLLPLYSERSLLSSGILMVTTKSFFFKIAFFMSRKCLTFHSTPRFFLPSSRAFPLSLSFVWLFGCFLTYSSTTRLYRGRAPRQSV